MKRSWWIQAALCVFLTGAAVVVLLPSIVTSENLPHFLRAHARRMRPSVGVVAGLRLGYEVDVDEVVAARLRLLGSERLPPAEVDELVERSVQSALGKARAGIAGGCWGASVTREHNRIVIELPGISAADAPRIRSLIERY